ncbi:MAG TPA: anti-sigma factor [Acidimicrobiia bacterium]|nr:anti-sigma factor [Acidimicrobiia bacterium]
MTEDRADYLASASGQPPPDAERLDLIRDVLGRDATWAEPPPEVADRLIAAIEARPPDESEPKTSRRWLVPTAAAVGVAAVAILIAGIAGVFSSPDEQIVAIAGTELEPAASGEAAIRESGSGWWIRLDVDDLPAAEVGTYYEGWVWNDQGEGVSIGTFHLRGDTEPIVLWSGVDPADYPAIWVTLEEEDGDPSASEQVVMRGRP